MHNNNLHDIVIGLQYGDEGKGKVVNALSSKKEHYTHCIRFNGGPNAGHTVYHNNNKIVLHQIPIGILFGKKCLIGPGCVINITKLSEECRMLKNLGYSTELKELYIAYNAHIISPEMVNIDKVKGMKIGSTGNGIAQAYSAKMNRVGSLAKEHSSEITRILELKLVDSYDFCRSAEKILFEGAQGFGLDIDHGKYPYVTSSTCTVGGVYSCGGISHHNFGKVYGIAKPYETYVGSKEFQNYLDADLEKLQMEGEEIGATTGRPRQCNWLDISGFVKAINTNGVTNLIFNKCDIFESVGIFKTKNPSIHNINTFDEFKTHIEDIIFKNCESIEEVVWSGSPKKI